MKSESQRVFISKTAIENYGDKWQNVELVVTHAANKYMPAEKFFSQGKPTGYHPGYDESVSPQGLYDLKRADNDEQLAFSLYDWELE